MKVLFMTCGIGIGHVSRDITLAKKLEEKDVNVAFASYGSGYEMLSKQGKYKICKLPDIQFYGGDGKLDIKYTAKKSINMPLIFLKSIYHESKIIKEFKEDSDLKVLNGRWGPYINVKKDNFKIPKGVEPASLTYDDCKKIIKEAEKKKKTK